MSTKQITLLSLLLLLSGGGSLSLFSADLAEASSSSSSVKSFECPVCNKIYRSKWNLKEHKMRVHEGHRIKCPICNHKVTTQSVLKRHLATVHKPNREHGFSKCSLCNKNFNDRAALIRHAHREHQGLKTYKCRLSRCTKWFPNQEELKQHKMTVQGAIYECKIGECKYVTTSNGSLKGHETAIHEHKQDHKCKYCDKRGADKSNMTRHEKTCPFQPSDSSSDHDEDENPEEHWASKSFTLPDDQLASSETLEPNTNYDSSETTTQPAPPVGCFLPVSSSDYNLNAADYQQGFLLFDPSFDPDDYFNWSDLPDPLPLEDPPS